MLVILKKIYKKKATPEDKLLMIELSKRLSHDEKVTIEKNFDKWKADREAGKYELPTFKEIAQNFKKNFEKIDKKYAAAMDIEMNGAFF
mmetsp:Transcript_27359/g.24129  ORF Transcript_27359/g.24129 Transcript_27359/m.24129 type:complete len:89 (+) Transcript_27359:189-455(+)|eukprot:CAMPEP_0114599772 /NCGR_PEP_ID=MMETSP0125-20121206/22289_1 /TAXON_ID=485358 ORGANISM="Aristerostoma sp., Strain ATCC 50986" /NCGR_SAMPLE_ID=MMETSP0125 /ASSEMBLY_ACC=CAM_ASM_000245 /LENGTH=88 /DNA_ID=CAMNT_0001807131 /DNA_START=25 /DNA_END=291 /DNA_ORIENTATION=+